MSPLVASGLDGLAYTSAGGTNIPAIVQSVSFHMTLLNMPVRRGHGLETQSIHNFVRVSWRGDPCKICRE